MNETMKQLWARKSVRIFEEKLIADDLKQQILQSAIQAPTAGNQVLYTILDIQNKELKEKLAVSCDNQSFIAKAPLVLVFVADCRRWHDAYVEAGAECRDPGVGDLILACQDTLIAAQNTVVAAESLGIGSCYIGDIIENKEDVTEMLHLDEWTFPVCMVVYGWPTQQQKERKKPNRFDEKYIVQTDTYRRLTPEQHREMYKQRSEREDVNFDKEVTAFCNRKYMSDFSEEMTRSTGEYLKNFVPFSKE